MPSSFDQAMMMMMVTYSSKLCTLSALPVPVWGPKEGREGGGWALEGPQSARRTGKPPDENEARRSWTENVIHSVVQTAIKFNVNPHFCLR